MGWFKSNKNKNNNDQGKNKNNNDENKNKSPEELEREAREKIVREEIEKLNNKIERKSRTRRELVTEREKINDDVRRKEEALDAMRKTWQTVTGKVKEFTEDDISELIASLCARDEERRLLSEQIAVIDKYVAGAREVIVLKKNSLLSDDFDELALERSILEMQRRELEIAQKAHEREKVVTPKKENIDVAAYFEKRDRELRGEPTPTVQPTPAPQPTPVVQPTPAPEVDVERQAMNAEIAAGRVKADEIIKNSDQEATEEQARQPEQVKTPEVPRSNESKSGGEYVWNL